MLRQPLSRALALTSPVRAAPLTARRFADQVQAQPEKVEVFIDDQPVHVVPGTTVLQVCIQILYFLGLTFTYFSKYASKKC